MKRIATYWHNPGEIPERISRGELAKRCFAPDLTFDFALPWEWLTQKFTPEERERIVCQCVWCYPPRSIFGEAVNMLTGEVES